MSYADLVVLCGEGTTVGGTGILTITNNNIAAGDIAIGQLGAAGATAAKVVSITNAGSATFTATDVAGAAVAIAVAINFVILRPSCAGLRNGF